MCQRPTISEVQIRVSNTSVQSLPLSTVLHSAISTPAHCRLQQSASCAIPATAMPTSVRSTTGSEPSIWIARSRHHRTAGQTISPRPNEPDAELCRQRHGAPILLQQTTACTDPPSGTQKITQHHTRRSAGLAAASLVAFLIFPLTAVAETEKTGLEVQISAVVLNQTSSSRNTSGSAGGSSVNTPPAVTLPSTEVFPPSASLSQPLGPDDSGAISFNYPFISEIPSNLKVSFVQGSTSRTEIVAHAASSSGACLICIPLQTINEPCL